MEIIMFILAFVLSVIGTGMFIPMLKKQHIGQEIREEGPKEHYAKRGTPTMGGLLFTGIAVILALVATLVDGFHWGDFLIFLSTIGFGAIGFLDDYEKVKKKQNLGLNEKQKLVLQIALSAVVVIGAYLVNPQFGSLKIPFFNVEWNLGLFSIPILMFILVGTVNAVNLTDGLDGLLGGVSLPVFTLLTLLGAGLMTRLNAPSAFYLPYLFIATISGFLFYNANPASIFMGDTGSMAIGGAVGILAIMSRTPIFLVIYGGIYFVEALSVILQVISYRYFNHKRIFLMSPIHHHFEKKGYPEQKITMSFTVVSVILCILAYGLYF